MNGNVGPNAATGNLTAKMLKPVRNQMNKQQGMSLCSREELLRAIADTNEKLEQHVGLPQRLPRACSRRNIQWIELVVGSMDADALYPSCKVKEAAAHVREGIRTPGVNYNGVD